MTQKKPDIRRKLVYAGVGLLAVIAIALSASTLRERTNPSPSSGNPIPLPAGSLYNSTSSGGIGDAITIPISIVLVALVVYLVISSKREKAALLLIPISFGVLFVLDMVFERTGGMIDCSFLNGTLVGGVALSLTAFTAVLLYHYTGTSGLFVGFLSLGIGFVVLSFLPDCGEKSSYIPEADKWGLVDASNVNPGIPSPIDGQSEAMSLLILIGLLLLLQAGVVLVGRRGKSRKIEPPEEEDLEKPVRKEGVKVSGGRGEIDLDVSVNADENSVYASWVRMVRIIGIDKKEVSPRQVVEVADERGYNTESVEALTRLFEEVRYGDKEVTNEIEKKARRHLNRIRD